MSWPVPPRRWPKFPRKPKWPTDRSSWKTPGGAPSRGWADLPPRQVRLDELVTTKDTLRLDTLLDEDSTFYGDLFAHVVQWKGDLYLEDGLHRALRAALQQRSVLHARVHQADGS